MPKERKIEVYSFEELSKDAQKRAIRDYREKGWGWDYHDTGSLSDVFKEMLEDKGFDDPEVNWSLGYCQGDGVCFSGTLDVEKYVKLNKLKEFKSLVGKVYVKVTNENSRYCHWNSMDVEVGFEDRDELESFIPQDIYEEMSKWEYEQNNIARRYREELDKRSRASSTKSRGVLEWRPNDVPLPPEPKLEPERARFVRAREKAEKEYKAAEGLMENLREYVDKHVKDISRELEKIGYGEIEYRDSDEVIADNIMANDYEFDEDGEML